MTNFVESFFSKQLLPPWKSEGCTMWGFVVRVEDVCIQRYLDNYLNGEYPDRAPYRYSLLSGPQFGLFNVAFHPKVYSAFPGNPIGWDTVSHTEIYWTFPVRRHRITPDNLLVEPRAIWVQPFAFDDNPMVVFGSREIWGSDSVVADIIREEGLPTGALHVDVAVQGFRHFSPSSVMQPLACVHMAVDPDATIDGTEALAANTELANLATLLMHSGVFAGQTTAPPPGSDAKEGVELNNLKQFRSVENWGEAVYRAIVASRTSHTEVDNVTFYRPGKVHVDLLWSDSMAETLQDLFGVDGSSLQAEFAPEHVDLLNPDENGVYWNLPRASLIVELAYSFTSNVSFEAVETLYTYGG